MFKHRLGISAALAAASILLSASAALAVEAAAAAAVNVRTGPGIGFAIVDKLHPGEVVEIVECAVSNWCFVQHDGPDGWVSAAYLTAAPGFEEDEVVEPESDDPDCSFGFTVGPGGPTLSINCGDVPPPEPPAPPAEEAEACFYTGSNYQGTERCYGVGTRNSLPAAINDRISSVRLFGDARARLCVNQNLGGVCNTINVDTPALGPQMNNRASSLRVFTGALPLPPPPPPPPAPPVTFSTGPIALQQTFTANLDNGAIGGAGTDIWYQAVSAAEKYITPQNGAQLALGDGSNRGYDGCSVAAFSGVSIPLWAVPPGTYVCARTNQGRISQFRLNGYVGTTMNLGYTTWAN